MENTSSRRYMKKIEKKYLTAIYYDLQVLFYKDGKKHNSKNGAYVNHFGYKQFWLNGEKHGSNGSSGYCTYFTKESWRKFVKLKAFL